MKELIDRLINWLLTVEFDWRTFGYSVGGSAVATLFPSRDDKANVRPGWQIAFQFAVGVLTSSALTEWVVGLTGLLPGAAGFLIGLGSWGIVGFVIDSARDPVALYERVRGLSTKKTTDNERQSGDHQKSAT